MTRGQLERLVELLDELVNVGLAVVSGDGRLLAANAGFRTTVMQGTRPAERRLDEVLASSAAQNDGALELASAPSPLAVTCRANGRPLRCVHFAADDVRLVAVEWDEDDADSVLESMSLLNNEMVTLSRELGVRNRELERANERITQLMRTDPLTGLANRRYLMERIEIDLSRSRRQSIPLAFILLDLDHFKRVNDTWGHVAGDAVLVATARALSATCRREDLPARFGGEEFVVLAPHADLRAGERLAERIRERLGANPVLREHGHVTASLGVAEFLLGEDAERLIHRADEALYAAKRGGRDRVVTAPGPDDSSRT